MRVTLCLLILFILIPIVSVSQIVVPTPSCDINGDGIVDRDDLYLLVQHWQVTGNSGNPTPTIIDSPTPRPTRRTIPPAPTNIRLEGEEVEGAYPGTFYDQVIISWDPIIGLDTDYHYYCIYVFYIEDVENFSYFKRCVDDATSAIMNINDPDFEPLGFTPRGYLFVLQAVRVTQTGGISGGEWSESHFFNLIRRPTPTPTPTAILTPTP